MKKIGILTYWGVPNYGAWIQAYALNNVIKEMHPNCQVEHIAYLEQSHWNSCYKNDDKGMITFLYNWRLIPNCYIHNERDLEEYECDLLITGSDSIWEESISGVFNEDHHLFGEKMHGCKNIISYAASAGAINIDEFKIDKIPSSLKKYKAISVRDVNTLILVEKAIGITPEIVIDPSLLWDFKHDKRIIVPSYNRYIAVYGMQWDLEFVKNLKNYARDRNLKLISIGFVNDWCDMSFRRNELRTLEWLGFIARAEAVATSTFHGLMMGLNFEKNVKFCQVSYVKNRSTTLVEQLEIENFINCVDRDLDYQYITPKLQILKKDSYNWLKSITSNLVED